MEDNWDYFPPYEPQIDSEAMFDAWISSLSMQEAIDESVFPLWLTLRYNWIKYKTLSAIHPNEDLPF